MKICMVEMNVLRGGEDDLTIVSVVGVHQSGLVVHRCWECNRTKKEKMKL